MSIKVPELSLQECIDEFFQKEEIEYRSDQCGHASGGVMGYSLSSLPRVLVIHLKRFIYTMTSNVGTKCRAPVTIPLELDLTSYCTPKCEPAKLVNSPVAPKETLKSEILSPSKLSPSTRVGKFVGKQCRKRILSDSDDSSSGISSNLKNTSENDENQPVRSSVKKPRSRSSGTADDESTLPSSSGGSSLVPSVSSSFTHSSNVAAKYQLSAIVSHTGTSSDFGHYTTDAFHSEQNRWFRFDDMAVKVCS